MSRYSTILVATDLSASSDVAIRRAHELAPDTLIVVHVVPESFSANPLFPQRNAAAATGAAELRAWAAAELVRRVAEVTGRASDAFEALIEEGRPARVIVDLAAARRVDLIVVATREPAPLDRVFLGSTAERVARVASVPVMVARAPVAGGAVVAATDLSDPSLPAVRAAAHEAAARAGSLATVFCVERLPAFAAPTAVAGVPYVPAELIEEGRRAASRRLEEVLARERITGERLVRVGIPEEEILAVARERHADLIVVGSHGRGGLTRFLLGSTAEGVVRAATCSVLVVRLADERA